MGSRILLKGAVYRVLEYLNAFSSVIPLENKWMLCLREMSYFRSQINVVPKIALDFLTARRVKLQLETKIC